jgi:7,8-dihydropterin-6-yl-methyl-4-(beta-D-ribofuranosyl)aminobenzene 5'-phosphate synthase
LVKKVKLTVLVEDSLNAEKINLMAKHGLSFFVEAVTSDGEVSIMMDTGPSSEALLHNVDIMGINLRKTGVIVLSHGHYDHVGGLIEVLKCIGKRVPIVVHPKIFNPKFKVKPALMFRGAPFTPSDVEMAGGVLLYAENPVTITEGITTTGEVERTLALESVEGFWTVDDGRFVKDVMLDDQALLIDVEGKGLVVVTGCAHSGVVNTVKHAKKITGTNKIYAVLGGFHLAGADNNRIETTVEELEKLNLEFIGPCHCTGSKAVKRLKAAFGHRCNPLQTGDIVEL